MADPEVNKNRYCCSRIPYHRKRRMLLIKPSIAIITNLIILIIALVAIHGGSVKDQETAKIVIITVSVVSILVHILGLVGALKEEYHVMYAYSVLCVLISGANIASALEGSTGSWFSVVMYLITSILAYSFAQDIRRRRTAPSQTTIVVRNPSTLYVQRPTYLGQTNAPAQPFNLTAVYPNAIEHDQIYSNTPVNYNSPGQQHAIESPPPPYSEQVETPMKY